MTSCLPVEPYDLPPQAAATILGAHVRTVKRWAKQGKLPAFKTPGGWWRFRKSDLDAFLAKGAEREPAA